MNLVITVYELHTLVCSKDLHVMVFADMSACSKSENCALPCVVKVHTHSPF